MVRSTKAVLVQAHGAKVALAQHPVLDELLLEARHVVAPLERLASLSMVTA